MQFVDRVLIWWLCISLCGIYTVLHDFGHPTLRRVLKGSLDNTRLWLQFPIVWSTIGLLRCASSTVVWETAGKLAHPALIIFCMHLALGGEWGLYLSR
jgi:hypothetical protein